MITGDSEVYECIKDLDRGLDLGVKVGEVIELDKRGDNFVADDFIINKSVLNEHFRIVEK